SPNSPRTEAITSSSKPRRWSARSIWAWVRGEWVNIRRHNPRALASGSSPGGPSGPPGSCRGSPGSLIRGGRLRGLRGGRLLGRGALGGGLGRFLDRLLGLLGLGGAAVARGHTQLLLDLLLHLGGHVDVVPQELTGVLLAL